MITGITFGAFDLLHAGHIFMLEEAKTQCDWLVVGLQSDPTVDRPDKNKPVQTLYERYVQLKACKFVDEIIPYTTEAEIELIHKTRFFDIRILGEDYFNKPYTGEKECEARGTRVFYALRRHNLSSTELRERIKK